MCYKILKSYGGKDTGNGDRNCYVKREAKCNFSRVLREGLVEQGITQLAGAGVNPVITPGLWEKRVQRPGSGACGIQWG